MQDYVCLLRDANIEDAFRLRVLLIILASWNTDHNM